MAFPRTDRQYTLIADATTGTVDTRGGLGAIITQADKEEKFYAISFATRQLKDHEKNYSPLLLFPIWSLLQWGVWTISTNTWKERNSSQAFRKTWAFTQQNHEPISNSCVGTWFHHPVQEMIRYASGLHLVTTISPGRASHCALRSISAWIISTAMRRTFCKGILSWRQTGHHT